MSDTPDSVFVFTGGDPATAEKPQPLPVGEYRAVVREGKLADSKSGNRMLVLSYVVSADQYPPDFTDGDPDGTLLTQYIALKDDAKGRFRIKQAFLSHGLPPKREVNPTQFFGAELVLKVEHEMYEGEPQPRIRSARPV